MTDAIPKLALTPFGQPISKSWLRMSVDQLEQWMDSQLSFDQSLCTVPASLTKSVQRSEGIRHQISRRVWDFDKNEWITVFEGETNKSQDTCFKYDNCEKSLYSGVSYILGDSSCVPVAIANIYRIFQVKPYMPLVKALFDKAELSDEGGVKPNDLEVICNEHSSNSGLLLEKVADSDLGFVCRQESNTLLGEFQTVFNKFIIDHPEFRGSLTDSYTPSYLKEQEKLKKMEKRLSKQLIIIK